MRKILLIKFLFISCILSSSCSKQTTLPEGKWIFVNNVYVQFAGLTSENKLSFISAENPQKDKEANWKYSDAKYSEREGSVGDTVALGTQTLKFDEFARLAKTEDHVFIKFRIIAFDQAARAVTIQLL